MHLAVTWEAGSPEAPVTLKRARWVRLLGHDGLALGRVIRVHNLDVFLHLDAHAPFLRHELTHVRQQEGSRLFCWVLRYLFRPSFRRRMEADANAHLWTDYPMFRVIP